MRVRNSGSEVMLSKQVVRVGGFDSNRAPVGLIFPSFPCLSSKIGYLCVNAGSVILERPLKISFSKGILKIKNCDLCTLLKTMFTNPKFSWSFV